jgi:uncharacterized protein YeaO (DUF488 family)
VILPAVRSIDPDASALTQAGTTMREIRLKRAYEKPASDDGFRVLVERLWPRGLTKERAAVDLWMKDIAPSPELRRWYDHDPSKWDEFQKRYLAELRQNAEMLEQLREKCRGKPVTFVYAARDEAHNSALILKNYLERRKS